MRNVNQEIQGYGDNMSYYGYLEHSSLAHHGILGQKWGVRRYQNEDGSLTPEGRARYGIAYSDYQTGKKFYKGKGRYRVPIYTNLDKNGKLKAKKKAESILKYDAVRRSENNDEPIGEFRSINSMGILETQLIHHYTDKNGKVALSYARVPNIGDVFVKGNGNINDLNLNSLFYKVPKELKQYQNQIPKISNKSVNNIVKGVENIAKGYGDKAFSYEDIWWYAMDNIKGYANLSSEEQGKIAETVGNKLKSKGYYWTD